MGPAVINGSVEKRDVWNQEESRRKPHLSPLRDLLKVNQKVFGLVAGSAKPPIVPYRILTPWEDFFSRNDRQPSGRQHFRLKY